MKVSLTVTEAHSSLGLGERYQEPLRITFRKMTISHPNETDEYLLAFAVKAMNDTLIPKGYVPSALVFVEYPRVFLKSEVPTERDTVQSRAKMLHTAWAEVAKIMAELRVKRALRHSVPVSVNATYEPGDLVLVRR